MTTENQQVDPMLAKAMALDSDLDATNDPDQAAAVRQANEALEGVGIGAELAEIVGGLVVHIKPVLPTLAQVLNDDALQDVFNKFEKVCIKRGWLKNGIGGKYAEELALATSAGLLGYSAYVAVNHDLANNQKAAIESKTE